MAIVEPPKPVEATVFRFNRLVATGCYINLNKNALEANLFLVPHRLFYLEDNEFHVMSNINEDRAVTQEKIKEAFNALLKTLEEPPAHVKFMFATTEPEKVLPTILSRCQRFDLTP